MRHQTDRNLVLRARSCTAKASDHQPIAWFMVTRCGLAQQTSRPPRWTKVNSSPLIRAADGSFTVVDTNAPTGAAFYRAFQY